MENKRFFFYKINFKSDKLIARGKTGLIRDRFENKIQNKSHITFVGTTEYKIEIREHLVTHTHVHCTSSC